MGQSIIVTIQIANVNGKAVATAGNRTFIISANGYYRQQEVLVDLDTAVEMPSFLYTLDVVFEGRTRDAINFIKENF